MLVDVSDILVTVQVYLCCNFPNVMVCCSAINCSNSTKKGFRFFKFPKEFDGNAGL